MTISHCPGWRRSRMRTARAPFPRARCSSRCCSSCWPERSSPEPCSGSAGRIRRLTGAPAADPGRARPLQGQADRSRRARRRRRQRDGLFDQRGRRSGRGARRAQAAAGNDAAAGRDAAARGRRRRRFRPSEVKEAGARRAAARRRAVGPDDPARRLCLDDQGRHGLEAAVGPLPGGCGAEQGRW